MEFVHTHMDYLTAATDMSDSWWGACSLDYTDVWVRDRNLTVLGQAFCNKAVNSDICDSYIVDIDYAAHVGWPAGLEQTVCHEIGHSVGFWHDTSHSDNSCMESPQQADGQHNIYSQHHKDHINARW
ncbi:MAG: hypothetical protein OEZ06_24300 [Myxococcales bacterium]|nr:hypothetical protein [Myxococcales bacterium]